MADKFCRKYVDGIFNKWDTDRSNVLDRTQLKNWLTSQMKAKPLIAPTVRSGFYELITAVDTNKDGCVDRYQLYEYCMNHYTQTLED